MQLSYPKTTIVCFVVVSCCTIMGACQNKETAEPVDKGGYPLTHPERIPKSIPQTIEKPDIEDEFFEADKLK